MKKTEKKKIVKKTEKKKIVTNKKPVFNPRTSLILRCVYNTQYTCILNENTTNNHPGRGVRVRYLAVLLKHRGILSKNL